MTLISRSTKDQKLNIALFRGWQHKTDPAKVAAKINSCFDKQIISPKKVQHQYSLFDQGIYDVFNNSPTTAFYCSPIGKEYLFNSVLLMTDDKIFKEKIMAKDGRFLVFTHHCNKSKESSLIVHDLFRRIKGTNHVSTSLSTNPPSSCISFSLIDNYLMLVKVQNRSLHLYVLKINYANLNVDEELGPFNVCVWYPNIVQDQLDNKRFVLCNEYAFQTGKYQEHDNKIVMDGRKGSIGIGNAHGTRLLGNKLQYFNFYGAPNSESFCDIDMDTMKKVVENVSVDFGNGKRSDVVLSGFSGCWSNSNFYLSYETENTPYQLVCFNVENLKWSKVGIFAQNFMRMFVDKNEVMTFQIGDIRQNSDKGPTAIYRVALRCPEKLMDLTQLAVTREFSLYESRKYINVLEKLQI